MRNKASTNGFIRAYNIARLAGLVDLPTFHRVFLFSYFLYKRWYEDPFSVLVKRHPEMFAQGNILDVGANVGYTACLFATACKVPAKVYAFEPDRANFATLAQVLGRKKVADSVEIFRMAVGSADGMLEFWHNVEHAGDHRVVTAQFKSSDLDHTKITTVPVTSIDNFVLAHDLRNVSFIKIDVQGYELAVCEGMQHTLERFPSLSIACEYAPDGMQELGFEPAALLHFFRSAGYQLHTLTRRSIQLATDDREIDAAAKGSGYVDLLCSRKTLN